MNATTGAQGALVAISPRATAVVPHGQKGVAEASATAPNTATPVRRRSHRPNRSVPTYTFRAAAAKTLTTKNGQFA